MYSLPLVGAVPTMNYVLQKKEINKKRLLSFIIKIFITVLILRLSKNVGGYMDITNGHIFLNLVIMYNLK